MSGDELLSKVNQLYPDLVKMLFSGYLDIGALIKAVNEGRIFRYIVKPCELDELLAIVRQAAEHCDLLCERKRLIAEFAGEE